MKRDSFEAIAKRWFAAFRPLFVSEWAILLTIMLVPVVMLRPGFIDPTGPVKQSILAVGVALATAGWVMHAYKQKKWERRASWMIWVPCAIPALTAISAALSPSGFLAWAGLGGYAFTAVVPTAVLVLLYLLVLDVSDDSEWKRRIVCALFVGAVISLVVAVLEYFGVRVFGTINEFPGFNTLGTTNALVIFSGVMAQFAIAMFATQDKKRDVWLPTKRWALTFLVLGGLTFIGTLFFLLVTDAIATIIPLLIGNVVFLALGLYRPQAFSRPRRFLMSIGYFAVLLILLIFPSPFTGRVPVEATPSLSHSLEVTMQSLKSSSVLFGTGPATYRFNELQYRPLEFNQDPLWQLDFDRGASHILMLLSTWGVLAVIALFVFVVWLRQAAVRAMLQEKKNEDWQQFAILASVWAVTLVAQLTYTSNLSLQMQFWVVTALVAAIAVPHREAIKLKVGNGAQLTTSLLFVGSSVLAIVVVVASLQWMIGDTLIAQAGKASAEGRLEDAYLLAEQARSYNKWHAGYARAASIARVRFMMSQNSANGVGLEVLQPHAQAASVHVQEAVNLEPRDIRNHLLEVETKMALLPFFQVSYLDALRAYDEVERLEPNDPTYPIDHARLLLFAHEQISVLVEDQTQREAVSTQMLNEAEALVKRALEVKPRFAPALYTRTLVLDRQGRLSEAIDQLVEVVKESPADPAAHFELGVLQLRAGRQKEARLSFETAAGLEPTFANAKWYLASLYELEGRIDDAIWQLEDLVILDPENTQVANKLELLRAGEVETEFNLETISEGLQ